METTSESTNLTEAEQLAAIREDYEKHQEELNAPAARDNDDDSDEGGVGLREYATDLLAAYWPFIVGGLAVVVMLFVVVYLVFGRSSEPAPQAAAAPQSNQQPERPAEPRREPASSAEDSGVVFTKPTENNGDFYLEAGSIAWKGKREANDSGEVLTLEGPTAAQFVRSVTLEAGSITTGVFGRAEPDKPILHATFHRTALGDQETTNGTYRAIHDDLVILEGTYSDERKGNTVTRTYTENAPGAPPEEAVTYRVTFESPAGTPIPALVGWKEPDVEAAPQEEASAAQEEALPTEAAAAQDAAE